MTGSASFGGRTSIVLSAERCDRYPLQSHPTLFPNSAMPGGDTSLGTVSDSDLNQIRPALQERVSATGLRAVAREVGLTASGLQKVLDGSSPFPKTRRKLGIWYSRHLAGDYRTARDVALEELLRQVPTSRRRTAREQILAVLRGVVPSS